KDNGKPQPNLATLDYTFTTELAPRYNIVGRIADAAGAPLPAVQVALSGDASAATITDGNGYYRFQDLLGGNYVITPSKEGYVFTPASRTVTLTDDVDNADFTGRLITYALSGQVTKAGRALPGVTITVGTRTVVTGNDGRWRVDGLTAGAYTVVPSLANHRFQPESRTVQIVNADIAGLDFEAIPLSYSIAGLVTDTRGNRLADVVISADGHKAVTGDNGRYSIGGVAAGTVNVRAEKQGWTFFWQDASGALQPLPRPVTVPPDQTDINFVGFRSVRASFSAGIHMIGVPIYPRDPVPMAVFGTPLVARWDPTRQPPAYLTAVTSPDAQLLRVEPGRGFFVRFRQNTDLEVAGEPVRTDAPFNMGLSAGWNMQANPFPAQVPLSSFTVTSGEVRPYAYVYDAVAGQYLLISSTPAVGVARSYVLPWEAVWLRALTSAALQVAPPAETAEAKSVESLQLDLGTGGWWIPVQATAGERTDSCCAVGVSARGDTVMLEKPPAMPGTVDVSIVDTDGARLSRAIVGGAKRTQSWQLVVTTDIPNAEVVLSLPDLSRVPHNITLTLTDLETNKSLYARTMAGYRFQVGAAGGQRRFRLTAEPRTTAGLVVSSASARLAGRNVVVTYSVTTSCQVHARVMNIAGRTVKTIASGSQVAAGVNSLAWDCTNATGAPVPAGMYLIEIEGVAADGQRARTVTQVRIPGR
ncbi:MAG: carboxypeptidase regulatory-like domain-containing protein, partial [Armatimonadetes bacterium]|nr:carboxypeptidase regulatory-like domain-containing protein [Armatimonadota bacterium]